MFVWCLRIALWNLRLSIICALLKEQYVLLNTLNNNIKNDDFYQLWLFQQLAQRKQCRPQQKPIRSGYTLFSYINFYSKCNKNDNNKHLSTQVEYYLLSLFSWVFFQFCLALWSPRLEKRELVYMFLGHLCVYVVRVTFCLFPLVSVVGCGLWLRHTQDVSLIFVHFTKVDSWLRLVTAAHPGCFINFCPLYKGRQLAAACDCGTPRMFH